MAQVLDEIRLYAGQVPLAPQKLFGLRIRLWVRVRAPHEQMHRSRRVVLDKPGGGALVRQVLVPLEQLGQVAGAPVRARREVSLEGSACTEAFWISQMQQRGAVAASGPPHHAPALAIGGDAQR